MQVYRARALHEEKQRVLRGAGNFRSAPLVEKLLQFSLSEQVRSQDTPLAIISAATHPLGRTLAWKFVKKHWKTFLDRYHGGGLNLLARLIGITSGFTRAAELEDAQEFFAKNAVPGIERAVRTSLEWSRSNIRWLERDRNDLRRYFSQ